MENQALYDVEGVVIRLNSRASLPEAYWGDGNWAPYLNINRLRKVGKPLTPEAAKPLMAAADTPQWEVTARPSA